MLPFIPGYPPAARRLLARFLPPLAEGVAAHYLEPHTRPGDLVFDPFGQAPGVAVEALQLGRRVLVSSFNPVSRLALSLAVRPPTEAELRAALTRLGDVRKDDDQLENFVLNLYRTACDDCGAAVSADAFEWDTGTDPDAPIAKIYLCPHCGPPPKQRPAAAADRALARRFTRGLDYHVLLDRVTSRDDPDREHAQEALAVYPPRSLTALAALLNKLDAFNPAPETRRLLSALLLAACDAACTLTLDRPKALAAPKRFKEANVWLAMEHAIGDLGGLSAPDRSAALPELLTHADRPAIHAHMGSVRDLMSSLPDGSCALVLTAIPRPNQAYWTLSALWAAWLWGRDSASTLRAVLRRRRYDWAWHANALHRVFSAVRPALAGAGKMIGLMPEAEPGFVAGALTAADLAGYALADSALRADTAEAQFVWTADEAGVVPAPDATSPLFESAVEATARQAGVSALRARGEPSRWSTLHFSAWRALAQTRRLRPAPEPDDALGQINRQLDPVFRDATVFHRLGADPDDDPATGLWYLSESFVQSVSSVDQPLTPLADRVEARVLRLLSDGHPVSEYDLLRQICGAFPGLQTPGRNLALACLSSYAQKVGAETWQLRPEDASTARARELESIQAELRALAVRHGYDVAGANPQEWREGGQTIYLFAVITSAVISGHWLGPQTPARRRFLVLPGGRAGLVAFKIRRDPRLRAAMEAGNWIIVKFRHVRRMAGDSQLTRATLEPALAGDPLEEAKQLALITGH
jgi:hypothetical protein